MNKKKIVAIVGSPRKGETLKVVQGIEKRLKAREDLDFVYVMLRDKNLKLCVGCCNCFVKGEEFCPHKDDRDELIALLDGADGVIFASPNYSLQVPALMKNFLDRLAFVFHRSRFFGKAFLAVVYQAVYGGGDIIKGLNDLAGFWGFNVAKGAVITAMPDERTKADELSIERGITKADEGFYKVLSGPRYPAPSLRRLFFFRAIRSSHRCRSGDLMRDARYFKEKDWLKSDYYYPAKLNPAQKLVGFLTDKLMFSMSKKRMQELVVNK